MLSLIVLAALLFALPAHAVTFYVDSEIDDIDALPGDGVCATSIGTCTLRAAIQETNALPGEDTIELPAGDFILAIPGSDEDAAATGDLDIRDDLIITGANLDETVIDGAGLDCVFDIYEPGPFLRSRVELWGVTVTGGVYRDAGFWLLSAGGIRARGAELSIFDSAVKDNLDTGIASYYPPSSVLISGSTVQGNVSDSSIGGVSAPYSTVTIEDSTILDNSGIVGGVFSGFEYTGGLIVRDSLISENIGEYSGGVSLGEGASGLIERTAITNNSSEQGAGGVGVLHTSVKISSSTVAGNRSDIGTGGIQLGQLSHADIHNSTISGNAGFEGGGIALINSDSAPYPLSISLSNSTIVENSAQIGAGIAGLGYLADIGIQNSIVAKNTASLGGPDCFIDTIYERSISSGGHNILGDASDCDFESSTGDQVGDADNPIDPRVGPLADNGGPTKTHALLAGSPAIDAIPVADCTYDDDGISSTPEVPLTEDQRGVLRPQGEACDIGAYEAMSCDDGIDNDRDGYIDWNGGPRGEPADPGCVDASDLSERDPFLFCDDGADNDGDGKTDFDPFTFANPGDETTPPSGSGDPGCRNPSWWPEDPQCQDGINNDSGQDGLIDYDGGQSIWGECTGVPGGCPANVSDPDGDGVANPDPQCVRSPWKNKEAVGGCGLGVELALLLPPVMWMWRRRARH